MTLIHNIVLLVQILSALGMIGLVLVQHGKGADMGAAFGSGSSGSLFGATGGANFLSRTTAVLATLFFVSTIGLSYLGTVRPEPSNAGSVLERTSPVDASIPAPAGTTTTDPKAPANNIPR
jgi:preprotein translocase subunit SecG